MSPDATAPSSGRSMVCGRQCADCRSTAAARIRRQLDRLGETERRFAALARQHRSAIELDIERRRLAGHVTSLQLGCRDAYA